MDDLLNQAKDQMDLFERVMHGVPGVKGYKEKELRRESDKTYRQLVAKQLDDQKARLDSLQADLARAGQLGLMDDLEQAGKKLQRLADRVRTASYGYAPLFDLVKVKEEQLDALMQYDQAMLQDVERISGIIDKLSTMQGLPESEWMESIRELTTTLDQLNTDFNHREEVILVATGDE